MRISWRPRSDAPGTARPFGTGDAATAVPFGLGASRSGPPLAGRAAVRIAALDPAWLAVSLLLDRDWRPRWERAVAEAEEIGVPLDIALVATDPDAIAHWAPARVPAVPVVRLQTFDLESHVTTCGLATAAARLRDAVSWLGRSSLAGGSRANFTELNRADALPLDLLDEVVFAASPQVHAVDDASILQTPAALAVAVRDAREIAGGRPVIVGPLTLRPVFNAVAADPRALAELPPDPRQHGVLAARWLVESLQACTAASGATLYETAGGWGLLDERGEPSPAYRALASSR